ncbi:substrate-binding periplasmic protein [Algicola sagamiensis]|uniref:substrate-binding periplasmic protein n=1 Tax=Algicola sagamiensis TaxID=163869 RepID=UPI000362C455|nr:ABC transporter substrate-binding protein [Algicola sagamiensis]
MKPILSGCILLYCLFSPVSAKQIVLTNGEWAPFLGQALPDNGLTSKLVTNVFEKMGYQVKYKFFKSWARAYAEAYQNPKYDGTLVWSQSPERAGKFLFTDSVLNTFEVFFYLAGSDFHWETIQDLEKYRIGGHIGYDYGVDIEKAEKSGLVRIDRVKSEHQNIQKLLRKRLDAVIMDKVVGIRLLEDEFTRADLKIIQIHTKPILKKSYHVLFKASAHQHRQLRKDFNQALSKMIADGEVDKQYQEYLNAQ